MAMLRVAPELIVIFLQSALADVIDGLKVVPDGMVTSVVDVGTPHVQFAAVFQLLLLEPSHVLACPHELLALSRKSSKSTVEKHDRCRREKVRKMRFWVIVVFMIKNLFIRFWVVLNV